MEKDFSNFCNFRTEKWYEVQINMGQVTKLQTAAVLLPGFVINW